MSNPTTLAAPTRRLLAGLIVTTIATASAGAWALTAVASDATDEPTTIAATVEDATAGRPTAIASDLVPAATRPIVVADAYHGVGIHRLPKRHRPDRRRRRLSRRRIHPVPVNPPASRSASRHAQISTRRQPSDTTADDPWPPRPRPTGSTKACGSHPGDECLPSRALRFGGGYRPAAGTRVEGRGSRRPHRTTRHNTSTERRLPDRRGPPRTASMGVHH